MDGQPKPKTDHLRIHDLAVWLFIGNDRKERLLPQRLRISLDLQTDPGIIQKAATSDLLADAVDYSPVCKQVRELAHGKRRILLETLASDIADSLLDSFPLTGVGVSVRKPRRYGAKAVSVEIERFKSEVAEQRTSGRGLELVAAGR